MRPLPERDIFPGRGLFSHTGGVVSSPRCLPLFPAVYRWLGTSLVHRGHDRQDADVPCDHLDRRRIACRDGDEVRPAVGVDLLDPDHQPEPLVPATTSAPGTIAGRLDGVPQLGPPVDLIVLSIQIGCSACDPTAPPARRARRSRAARCRSPTARGPRPGGRRRLTTPITEHPALIVSFAWHGECDPSTRAGETTYGCDVNVRGDGAAVGSLTDRHDRGMASKRVSSEPLPAKRLLAVTPIWAATSGHMS